MTMIHLERSSNRLHLPPRVKLTPDGSAKVESFIKERPSLFLLLTILLLFFPLMGRAQELAATLNGVVSDSSGAVIPHASISIALNGVNGTARVVESDGAGNYVATNLTAGTYTVTADWKSTRLNSSH